MLRQVLVLAALLSLATACATIHPEPYDNLSQAMEVAVQPFAEELLPRELTKDPEAVDYPAIEAAAKQAEAIFVQMQTPARKLYEPDQEMRDAAKTAATWFGEVATAAHDRQHLTLVALFGGKAKICANCHGDQ